MKHICHNKNDETMHVICLCIDSNVHSLLECKSVEQNNVVRKQPIHQKAMASRKFSDFNAEGLTLLSNWKIGWFSKNLADFPVWSFKGDHLTLIF